MHIYMDGMDSTVDSSNDFTFGRFGLGLDRFGCTLHTYLGVSKYRGTAKWMVKIMENPIKMDDLGKTPYFSETSIYHTWIL